MSLPSSVASTLTSPTSLSSSSASSSSSSSPATTAAGREEREAVPAWAIGLLVVIVLAMVLCGICIGLYVVSLIRRRRQENTGKSMGLMKQNEMQAVVESGLVKQSGLDLGKKTIRGGTPALPHGRISVDIGKKAKTERPIGKFSASGGVISDHREESEKNQGETGARKHKKKGALKVVDKFALKKQSGRAASADESSSRETTEKSESASRSDVTKEKSTKSVSKKPEKEESASASTSESTPASSAKSSSQASASTSTASRSIASVSTSLKGGKSNVAVGLKKSGKGRWGG